MKIIIKILGGLSIIIGVFATFMGMMTATEGNTLPIVIGGGLFMALGVAVFVYHKNS